MLQISNETKHRHTSKAAGHCSCSENGLQYLKIPSVKQIKKYAHSCNYKQRGVQQEEQTNTEYQTTKSCPFHGG